VKFRVLAHKTIADSRGILVAGALGIFAILWLHVFVYPEYGELEQMQFPDALEGLFGEAGTIALAEGYIAAVWSNSLLLLGILAVIMGTAAIAGDEQEGTLDLLLAQPVRRSILFAARATGLFVVLSLIILSSAPALLVGNLRAELPLGSNDFLLVALSGIAPASIFLAFSLCAGALLPSRTSTVVVSSVLLVVLYLTNALAGLSSVIEAVRNFSPFYWSDASVTLDHGLAWGRFLGQLLAAGLLFGVAAFALERREIATGPAPSGAPLVLARFRPGRSGRASPIVHSARFSLFQKTFRDIRGTTIAAGIGAFAFALLLVWLYPAYREALQGFEYPGLLQGLLGEAESIASPEGYMSAEYFLLMPILLGIVAIVFGTGATAAEERAGTLDLLLAQPLARRRLLAVKVAAAVLALTIVTAAGIPGLMLGKQFADIDLTTAQFAAASTIVLLHAGVWYAAAVAAGAVLPNRSAAMMVVSALFVSAYLLQVVGATVAEVDILRRISPFYWADASQVLVGGVEWWRVAALVATAIGLLAVAFVRFEERDVSIGDRGWRLQILPRGPKFGGDRAVTKSQAR